MLPHLPEIPGHPAPGWTEAALHARSLWLEGAMDRVGRYQLLDKLGEGGMGVVYKAYDPLIQRVVAVKLIGAARTDDPVLRERFFAEARAAGHLSHRNIVTVYDLGEDNGRPYFAMEFLEGQDLGRMIRSGQPASLLGTIDLMAQAGRGLAYAHARGVVHRDIKPANIFVTTAGDVKVLDFGLARLARPLGSDLTRTRPFIGTVSYMAPEQVRGEPADARTDLFAFGVVLYEMLSGGRPAFETDSFASTMHRILTEEPEPLAALDASLPADLIAIVERALAKTRDDRYQRVDDMLADIAAFRTSINLAGEPPRARTSFPETPDPRTASVDGLGITIGHEAAVALRTPLPRELPPDASPSSSSPPHSPASSSAEGRSRSWRPGPWVAALIAVAALATTFGWRAMVHREAPPADRPTGIDAAAAGTTGLASVPTVPASPARQDDPPEAVRGKPGAAAIQQPAPPPEVPPARAKETEEPRRTGRPAPGEAARSTAQAALVAAARAKGRAESAGADHLAAGTFARAVEAEREASARFHGGAFERARVAFGEVAGLFERAEAEARAEQDRQREERARQAAAPPPPTAPEIPTIPPSSGAGTSGSPGAAVTGTPGTSAAGSGASGASGTGTPGTSTGASGASGTPGTSTSGTSGTASTPSTTREAILTLLSRYAAALEARSLPRLRQVWPGLSGTQERAIADEFQHARSISVSLAEPRIEMQGATAIASCRRTYRLETQDGQRLETVTRTLFTLRQSAGGWVIEQVRHEQ